MAIIFIYGDDEYRVAQKQKERVESFLKKYPHDINWRVFDFSERQSFDDFKIFAGSLSMFSEKKLAVILEPTALKKLDDFKDFIEKHNLNYSSEIFIIIRGGDFKDKKYLLWQEFLGKSAKEIHKFDKLSGAKLIAWIKKEVKDKGGDADNSAVLQLAVMFNKDSGRLSNEIDKLIAYKFGEKIIKKDISDVCGEGFLEEKIFSLIDKIFSGRRKEAILLLERLIRMQEADFIFNTIVGQIRNLAKIKFGAGEIKFHPFYLRKMTELASNYDLKAIKKIYEELSEIDAAVKAGKIGYKEGLENFAIKTRELFIVR